GGPTIAGAPFYDLSNVQVLNGPQGTLFGRANTAGAVLVEPNRPKMNQLSGSLDVSLGNYDAQRITAVVNVPIITDQLAFRAAYNRTKVDGYTKLIGRSRGALNGVGTENLRLSLLFRRGGFTNYTVAESLGVNQTSGGYSVVGVNPNIAILNLPANIAAPNGLTAGTATFGTVCRSAVTAGLSPDLNTCIDQRLRAAATIKPIALAELARTQATHDGIRSVLPSADLDQYETLDSYTVVNNSQLDLGKIGFTTVTLKNIFGFQAFTGGSAWVVDGVGGIQQESISTSGFTPQAFAVSAQQTGKHAYFDEGPYAKTYSNETQVRGVVGEDLIVWSLGGYYQRAPVPVNPNGIRNLSKSNMGLALATGGYNPSFAFLNGGYTQQKALYASTTVDLSRFASAIAGLHVTGGLRKSWDHQLIKSLAAVTDVPTGRYVPGTATQAETKSNGYNYSIALDAQITDDLLVYGTPRKGYRPGGINNVTNASLFPNYTPTYAPETVKDIEFGAKYDFAIGDARGRINGAAYRTEYSNIQRQFSGAIGGATATYIVNASAALIKGGELQGQLVWGAWDISSNYAFTDAKFTRWIGSDPLALIRPGNTQCLPGSSTSICLIDLSQNPFAGVPRHSGSVTVKYHVPLSDHLGDVSASATLYAQSVKYFADYATRAQT
ncbi:MAG: TonB-dependent receptor, partial [Betaproteobacteria bacterium]